MVKVPTIDSYENINPTPTNPATAGALGESVADLGKGIEAVGGIVEKLDNQRQTLKAQAYLARAHRENYQLAATDPDIDNLEEKINANTDQAVQDASKLIVSTDARNTFLDKATYQSELRNVPITNMIMRRKSQDFKNSLVTANDEDIKTYLQLADPEDRKLLRQGIEERTAQAIDDGHVNAQWAKLHVNTLLNQADIDQVKNDMSVNADETYKQLQKGEEGLYPDISSSVRKKFIDDAQKQMVKQGSDNNHIFAIAQNHAENQLVDKLAAGHLTQDDISQSQLMGINGIKVRPDFARAATEALQDPFPTSSSSEKYNSLFSMVTDPSIDPNKAKLDILKSRGITPEQKAHLINGALREDDTDGHKKSLDQMIQDGVQKNKQEIMELNSKIQKSVDQKRTFLGGVSEMFADHAKDDSHLASLQQQFMSKISTAKDQQDMLGQAKEILNRDTLVRNPKISTADEKGTIFMDKVTGSKRRYFPDGHFEPVK